MPKIRKRRRTAAAVSTCLAALLTLAACGSNSDKSSSTPQGTAAAPSTPSALYAKAKQEGTVTVYGPFQSTYKPLYDAFTKAYPGVTIKTVDLVGPPLTARLQAEVATNKVKADLLATGPVDLDGFAAKGWLSPYKPSGAAQLPSQYVGDGDQYIEPLLTQTVVAYNTSKIKPDALPHTWKDLTSPSFKGKLAIPDPALPGLASQSLAAAQAAGVIDEAGLKALAANSSKYPNTVAAIQAVATGQKPIGVMTAFQLVNNAATSGAPLKSQVLSDGTPATGLGYAIMAKGKHKAGPQLLINWLLTPAAQKEISAMSLQGTMPGAPAPAGGLPGLSELKTLSMDLPAEMLAKSQKQMTSIFGH